MLTIKNENKTRKYISGGVTIMYKVIEVRHSLAF